MQIEISVETKKRLAKGAIPNKLLTPDERKKRNKKEFNSEELVQIFDRVWNDCLKQGVKSSKKCEDAVLKKLQSKYSDFISSKQEQRDFNTRTENLLLAVQLKPLSTNHYELTQLWLVPNSDFNPKCIYVCCEDEEEREKFDDIAEKFGYESSSALTLKLLRDFADTVKMYSTK